MDLDFKYILSNKEKDIVLVLDFKNKPSNKEDISNMLSATINGIPD